MRKHIRTLGASLVIAVLVALALGLTAANVAPPAEAACPNSEDLYCAPLWTPAMQAQKNRLAWLDTMVAGHAEVLKGCDDVTRVPAYDNRTCVENFDYATHGLLYAVADHNHLPRDKTVLASIALNWEWGVQATKVYHRELGQTDWNKHFAPGMIALAVKLDVNPPLVILNGDEMTWCATEEYGGVCPGKWQ